MSSSSPTTTRAADRGLAGHIGADAEDPRLFPPEPTFTRGPARRPQEPERGALLQWASGLQTTERRLYAGWFVEAGKDEALDEGMRAAGFPQVNIKHGGGNVVTHWQIETANLFVIAEGVQTIGEMRGDGRRYGIAFGWTKPERRATPQSWLKARVFLRELLAVGYAEPLTLTVKGTLTGDLIAALIRQYDVLDAAKVRRTASNRQPFDLPLYAFSIPLGPGADVTRGSGDATKEITPMVAMVPPTVDDAYLKTHWAKAPWVAAIEAELDAAIDWSVTASASEGGEGN